MSTVITAKPTLDKSGYNAGETATVSIAGASASATATANRTLTLTLTADDGTTLAYSGPLPVTTTSAQGVRITAVALDGVAGTITAGGQTATVLAK